jgi:CHASE1-domain containing sensor protein
MNWWTWWVGDVIGVIIFTPLVLIGFAQPPSAWRPRRLSVALPLCAAFAVTTIGFFYAQRSEMSQVQLKFERRVGGVFQDIQEHLTCHLDAVHSVKSLYASSVNVERNEFATFNQHLLSRHTGVQAMEWLPRVSREQRAEYEARARAEGFADFVFTEYDAAGQLVAAGDREEYYPVFFVEPRASNEAAIGFDVASDPDRREALYLARDSGRQVATGPLTLVQETTDQTGLLVFDPIYAKDMPLSTVADRRRALQGYVLGVFRVDDMVQALLHQGSPREFRVKIVDAAAAPDKQVICSTMENGSFHKAVEMVSHVGGRHRLVDNVACRRAQLAN